MTKIINKHPFLSGFVVGFVGIGIVSRGIKKLLKGKITIIQIGIPKNETFGNKTSGEENPKVTEEN